jgi:hypothetical protein
MTDYITYTGRDEPKPHLIGFSLSFCIADIVHKKVALDDVFHIVTGCSPQSEADVVKLLDYYSDTYWKGFADDARLTFNALRYTSRIQWCSAWNKNPTTLCWGHWLSIVANKL